MPKPKKKTEAPPADKPSKPIEVVSLVSKRGGNNSAPAEPAQDKDNGTVNCSRRRVAPDTPGGSIGNDATINTEALAVSLAPDERAEELPSDNRTATVPGPLPEKVEIPESSDNMVI